MMIFDGYTAQAATAEAYNLGNRRACFRTVSSLCDARNPFDLSRVRIVRTCNLRVLGQQ